MIHSNFPPPCLFVYVLTHIMKHTQFTDTLLVDFFPKRNTSFLSNHFENRNISISSTSPVQSITLNRPISQRARIGTIHFLQRFVLGFFELQVMIHYRLSQNLCHGRVLA